jgi:peptidoglycan/xylan/chitin deacetylase (PgdA/CDA1 family)
MARILMGYDTERFEEPSVTSHFLRTMSGIHEEYRIPCTLFLVGKVVESNFADITPLVGNPLFDLQQHSYSHRPFKTYVLDFQAIPDEEWTRRSTRELRELEGLQTKPRMIVHRGLSLDEIKQEVIRTQERLRDLLGIEESRGLTCPYAYYMGLLDRPDITDLLYELGIRFVRSWGRNHFGWLPTPFSVQPFFYETHGHEDLLEIPIQGWHDGTWKFVHGWANTQGYVAMLADSLQQVVEKDYTWSFLAHDWTSIRKDPNMSGIRAFIELALEQEDVSFLSHSAFYEQALAERGAA